MFETEEYYVTVYESSDGGTGDPSNTIWQFRIGKAGTGVFVTTRNHWIAETLRFAMESNLKVKVAYDSDSKIISQARIEALPPTQ